MICNAICRILAAHVVGREPAAEEWVAAEREMLALGWIFHDDRWVDPDTGVEVEGMYYAMATAMDRLMGAEPCAN